MPRSRPCFSLLTLALAMALAGAVFLTAPAHAATLDVSGGQLLGAFDVDVNGSLFDVAFVEGSCIALFSGCDENADFTFGGDSAAAAAAAQALIDQVFLDGPGGLFDTSAELTFGCSDEVRCWALTPFSRSPGIVNYHNAENISGQGIDSTMQGSTRIEFDTTGETLVVYAVWTPVPEPEDICTKWGFSGQVNGLCKAYCEAMDCDDVAPQASEQACTRVLDKIETALGDTPFPTCQDADSDGVPNGLDNCPNVANADQADADPSTPEGDACEPSL